MYSFEVMKQQLREAKLWPHDDVLDILKAICESDCLAMEDRAAAPLRSVLKSAYPNKEMDFISGIVERSKVHRVVFPYNVTFRICKRGYIFAAADTPADELKKKILVKVVASNGDCLTDEEGFDLSEEDVEEISVDYDGTQSIDD